MTPEVIEQISSFIMKFKREEHSSKVVEFTSKLFSRVKKEKLDISGEVFKNCIDVFVSFQQWGTAYEVLTYVNPFNVKNEKRTFQMVKENMIYCMDQNMRSSIKKKVDELENV
jgi:hypothetical protein